VNKVILILIGSLIVGCSNAEPIRVTKNTPIIDQCKREAIFDKCMLKIPAELRDKLESAYDFKRVLIYCDNIAKKQSTRPAKEIVGKCRERSISTRNY